MTTPAPVRTMLAGALAAALAAALFTAPPAGARLPGEDRAPTLPVPTLPLPTTATVAVDQLGPDSVVAVVSHGNFAKLNAEGLARSLEVITPDGVRHPVYTVQVRESRRGWFHGDFTLADWRPELHTALLRVSLGQDGDKLMSYDVTTGATKEVVAPQRANSVALDPDGSGVLMTTYPSARRPGRVGTLGWDGAKGWFRARSDGTAITSTDGRTLVTDENGARRWWLTDLATGTSSAVATPGMCRPLRWADADSVVASCRRRAANQLRLVDLDGTSSRLGIRHTERTRRRGAAIFDDEDVRTVRGRSWYESYGGCGGGLLTRQTASGVARIVRVPGHNGTLTLVGTRGDDLLVALQRTDCGSWPDRAVLSTFDPVSRTETVLTRLGRKETWREVIAATEVRSWIW